MAFDISRRSLFLGGLLTLAAPAVVRASSIMSIRDPKLVRGILIHKAGFVWADGPRSVERETISALYCNDVESPLKVMPWQSFEPLPPGRESLRHETVWLHESDRRVQEYRAIPTFETGNIPLSDGVIYDAKAHRQRREARLNDPAFRARQRAVWGKMDASGAVRSSLPRPYVLTDGNVPLTKNYRAYGGVTALPTSLHDPHFSVV